jgi:GDP-4-dehydro-6-deoxy-D-mannose reductase
MIVLILGSLGFTGRNLRDFLNNKQDVRVVGVDSLADGNRVDHVCDLRDYGVVDELLRTIRPDQIYNVAGNITNNYNECYASNVIITKNLLDVMESIKLMGRILLVGSAAEYGLVCADDLPVKETQIPNPVSIYGLTKAYQSVLMRTYRNLYDLDIVMVRPFNLIGEGISENLFPGRLQRSIRDLNAGKIKRIKTGSLDARRDYIHVNDALVHYQLVMNSGVVGETYNVGSGRSILLRDLLENLLNEQGLDMSVVDEMPVLEKNKLDVPDIYSDISKLESLRRKNDS